MSGENFYNRQAQGPITPAVRQPTLPTVSGANGAADKLPQFATFEKKEVDQTSDERVPLTARSASDRSANNPVTQDTTAVGTDPYRRSPSRDQYGNPISPTSAYGVRRDPSFDRNRGRGGIGPQGAYRGRGGYPARGGYGPPGQGRGGYGQGRGGYGPPGGRGGYGPPPRGAYGGGMRGGRPPPGYPGSQPSYGRTASPYGAPAPGYAANASMPSVSTGTGSYEAYNPDRASLPRAESPPPLPGEAASSNVPGQAVEMDATTGSPAHAPQGYGQFGQIRDSDADVAGMVGLQQARASANDSRHMSESSRYSSDE
jgi:hypothetical protein